MYTELILYPMQQCTDICCNPATCTLADGAECARGLCCDRSQCKFRSSEHVCRPPVHAQCDIAELCTGDSSFCPEDVYVQDGSPCGSKTCYEGNCQRSINEQCNHHWGKYSYMLHVYATVECLINCCNWLLIVSRN